VSDIGVNDFRDFEKTTVRVRYADTDRMGVVYHANYFEYFETGRADFIRRVWKPYAELEREGLILPVIEAGCRYYKGAEYDDILTVCTRVADFSGARLRFQYTIFKSSEIHSLAEGFTVHCFMTLQGKLRRMPSPLQKILEDLQKGIRS
jgi:acyl-CoA thioester hydrolase